MAALTCGISRATPSRFRERTSPRTPARAWPWVTADRIACTSAAGSGVSKTVRVRMCRVTSDSAVVRSTCCPSDHDALSRSASSAIRAAYPATAWWENDGCINRRCRAWCGPLLDSSPLPRASASGGPGSAVARVVGQALREVALLAEDLLHLRPAR